jgi:hypothetical protein
VETVDVLRIAWRKDTYDLARNAQTGLWF